MVTDISCGLEKGTVSREQRGYLHPGYAESLAEFGRPRFLPRSGGWILERTIPGQPYKDAMGCYPLFVCRDFSQLKRDLEDLGRELLTFTAVVDPFAGLDSSDVLYSCFKDVIRPFKEHFIVDLALPPVLSEHHKRNIQKARKNLEVERCDRPWLFLDQWQNLYSILVQRHSIRGIPAFSNLSFAKQLRVPGMVMFRATHAGSTIGLTLWYSDRTFGYYHLGAYDQKGYELKASFALFSYSIEYFRVNGLSCLDLGAGAGIHNDGTDGLSRFKRGWSTGTRPAYFCGRVFDASAYAALSRGAPPTRYFPAYRRGEFN